MKNKQKLPWPLEKRNTSPDFIGLYTAFKNPLPITP